MSKWIKSRLIEIERKHLWHPFTQMQEWERDTPLIVESGEGSYLIDIDGKRYLDGVSSLWVNIHGHRKKGIDRAIIKQLGRIAHSTLLGLSNIPSIELAERLVKIAPAGLTRVFYSDNGSTAVEIALKMAYQYWQQSSGHKKRRAFLSFTGAYHGDTFGAMSVGEIDIFVKKYRALLFKTYRAPYPYCYRCPIGKRFPDCNIACADELEKLLEKHHKEIAACIIEPMVQGAAGMIVAPGGFLKKVERLCRRYEIPLIADEVATGFGRTGMMFACEHEDVRPDFLCLAKGITGGYMPLAATMTTERIYRAFLGRYEEFKAFFHGHTYTGNQLGCSAAVASIDMFKKNSVIQKMQPKIKIFSKCLDSLKGLKHVGDIRHIGLMAGIELVRDKKTKMSYQPKEMIGKRVCHEARRYGLIIRPLGDTIVLMPPLGMGNTELESMVRIVKKSIKNITE